MVIQFAGEIKMASTTSPQKSLVVRQQALEARRDRIVRELERINREIAEAERRIGRVDANPSTSAQQSRQMAA